ncbi:energy transducer TonB [Ramlibacter sp. USB13]|uniref:Protein TonB n=1 Tax=Ramlibacter cellulosilyticus TaxID=2764187 RepID=A0A923MU16_9BURK|nr:energy transducer TonB [Ramlibacter cellulosilyticus]MBC5785852.1 energy transducer TonB [Ramlibacter cellulosilyticus]
MSDLPLPAAPSAFSRRNLAIAGGVVFFHVAALWALQSGLVRRAVEVFVPVMVTSEIITPPAPKVEAPPKPPEPAPAPRPVVQRKPIAPPPAPKLTAAPDPVPAPNAPTATTEPQPAPPPVSAPVAAAPAPVAPAPPPKVELPSSSADYLQNPKPAYPPASKRLGEQGKVVVRVLIGVDGTAQDAQLKTSSGYERLDQAALETVRKWRYVPGKRGGVAEAMWFDVPIHFVLE